MRDSALLYSSKVLFYLSILDYICFSAGIEDKGKAIKLRITDPSDLNRDVLKVLLCATRTLSTSGTSCWKQQTAYQLNWLTIAASKMKIATWSINCIPISVFFGDRDDAKEKCFQWIIFCLLCSQFFPLPTHKTFPKYLLKFSTPLPDLIFYNYDMHEKKCRILTFHLFMILFFPQKFRTITAYIPYLRLIVIVFGQMQELK